MNLPEEYNARCLKIAVEALTKIAACSSPQKEQAVLVFCSDCQTIEGQQHRPSCHRQGLVTKSSYYRNVRGTDAQIAQKALTEMRRLP